MDETIFYYLNPDGAVSLRAYVGVDEITHPQDAVILTREEYESRLAAIEAQHEAEAAATRDQEQAQKRADYEALITLGLPAESAARISGYTPPS
ncbi:hypothetical protein ACFC09_15655 [Streptomyces sp. NPDC056161]|uniref:hypothetical protein n=1 Tax=Streptomyces sp. NPDC056161 TaxID=3345732 RepID=UPI0035D6669D